MADDDATLGKILGPAVSSEAVTPAIDAIVETYLRERREGERFLDTYRRVGFAPVKEAIYG